MPQAGLLLILLLAHSAHSCIYFEGSDLSQQILVIRRDREDYCIINATTKDGDTVPCKDNVTATKINGTHVRLNTKEELGHSTFIMSYGRNGTNGQYAQPYEGDCPNFIVVIENRKTPENSRERYGLYAAICLVLIISSIIGIYIKCKKDQSQKSGEAVCNGVTVNRLLENTSNRMVPLQAINTHNGFIIEDAKDGVRQ